MNRLVKFILVFILIIFSHNLLAQDAKRIKICGYLYDAKTNKPIECANVLLGKQKTNAIYLYTSTNTEGYFEFKYKGFDDSLKIKVSSIAYEEINKIVPAISKTYKFKLKENIRVLNEAVVVDRAIIKKNDTIVYNVSRFKNDDDRVIGEVLKKMPGLDVSKSGKISYNGEEITKFYVENLDLMGLKYGLAVNNIKAEDIEKVEILKNHKHIKALKTSSLSQGGVAVNLKLKENSKGTWASSLLAGGGYKPAMWTGEALGMIFSKKVQSLNVYKTNNTGDDVSSEISSAFYVASGSSFLRIKKPNTPPFEQNRYLRNNAHTLSSNIISKINDSTNISADIQYIHDEIKQRGMSKTKYNLESDP